MALRAATLPVSIYCGHDLLGETRFEVSTETLALGEELPCQTNGERVSSAPLSSHRNFEFPVSVRKLPPSWLYEHGCFVPCVDICGFDA